MKLNQGLVLAAALVVGSLAVTGCSKSADEDAMDEGVTTEQASVAADEGTVQAGFTQDARGFRGRGFGRGERAGFRRGERAGFRRGERRERRHERPGHRAWWRLW